jgi:hypothetical protein
VTFTEMQLGKNGVTDNFIKTIKNGFTFHENVRISVLKSAGHGKEKIREYNKKIHYLYEFNKSFKKLPKDGVKPSEVSKYFESNTGGDYMKKINQSDLFIGE